MAKPKSAKALESIESITIDGEKFDLSEELRVDIEDLDEIYSHQAEQSAYWNYQLARAKERLRELEDEYDQIYSVRYRQYYSKCENEDRTPTVPLVQSLTTMDKMVLEARENVRNIEAEVDILKMVSKAFDDRKTCVMGLGAKYRSEMESSGGSRLLTSSKTKRRRTPATTSRS